MFLDIIYNIVISPIEIIFDAIFCFLQENPGIAIIAISIVMNFLALPLYKRADAIQEEERNKTAAMKPWVDHIKKTFKGDERYMKLNEYYRIEGYKPIYALRSMFPLLLQIPFFIAAYHYLSTQPLLNGVSFFFLKDLGTPDQLLTIGSLSINVLPIVMTLINVISGYIYLRGFPLKDKIQTYGIAAIFLVLLYNSPSGLVFYWTLNQIFSVGKNVFMKLVKDQKIRNIIFVIFGVVFVLIAAIFGVLKTGKGLIIIATMFICCCLPLLITMIKTKIQDRIKPAKLIKPLYFALGAVFLSLFMGAMIPLAVIYSDPAEFVTQITTPISLVINNVSIFIGFFVLWLGIYYYLSKTRMRNVFTIAVWLLSGIFLINYLFFAGDYGVMSNYFVFEHAPFFDKTEMLINVIVVVAAACVLYLVIKKWKKIIPYIYTILLIACMCLSGFYCVGIAQATDVPETETASTVKQNQVETLTLSKTGKNVVVLMVDRAIGFYVPYIFNEKPELAQQFDGFTDYPNTISFGAHTKCGSPALYGGYEYSPLKLNERREEPLVDKHDEALSVMPALFSDAGYDVTVWDPPLAGYENPEKASTLYDFDQKIKTFKLNSHYAAEYYEKYGGEAFHQLKTNNLPMYCLFRVAPICLRYNIYRSGTYCRTMQMDYSESFLKEYAALSALSDVTNVKDEKFDQFLMLYNALPHNSNYLESPGYEPIENKKLRVETQKQDVSLNGSILHMKNKNQVNTYCSNMATFIQIGKWLDYLKTQGVYDNTRIIICSDHGFGLEGQIDGMVLEDGTDLEYLNCVLMEKDFNSTGDFKLSDVFMMNADVPILATRNTIADPINPFSGNKISNDAKKDEIVVTLFYTTQWNQTETLFDLPKGSLLKLKNKNIFDKNNWEKVQ